LATHVRSRGDAMSTDLSRGVRVWLPRGTGAVFLAAAVGLIVVGMVVLTMGFVHHQTSAVFASLLCNGLALAPLALYYGSSRDAVPSHVSTSGTALELGEPERLHCARCLLPLSSLSERRSAAAMEFCRCHLTSVGSWR
jgi:hypothetical protein